MGDPLIALHMLLVAARAQGGHDVVVVAYASGRVLAGAGAWPACEELASLMPLRTSVDARVREMLRDVAISEVETAGQPLLVCVSGGGNREARASAVAAMAAVLLTSRPSSAPAER